MWSLAGSQAIDQPIQPVCAWVLGLPAAADPASRFGLGSLGQAGVLVLSHAALGSAVLGLWVEQLASAPDALPPEVSGVGAPPGFQVWAPSSLICVRATGLQVSAGAAYPSLAQGRRGEGRQGPQLLPRVL